MKRLIILMCLTAAASSAFEVLAEPPKAGSLTVVQSRPPEAGRIDPKLFGNFIELLDDVVPGMWAEMLNDRSFEGVAPLSNWCYYDGAPDICDRQWDTNLTWSLDTTNVFNGARCARLSAVHGRPASLTQSGLAVKMGMVYYCSGWFRTDNPRLAVSVELKVLLPNGEWMELASTKLPALSSEWRRYSVHFKSAGETDRMVFELRAEGDGSVWADKLSLMPGDNLQGWRRDVIQTVKDCQPALVRWGGSVIDPGAYRWKNGIGDRDWRTPFRNQVWGRIDPNDVGIDEFCQFCELTGVEPLICVSFSDGAQSAADLVEYCNGGPETPWGAERAANGHPAPYHVRLWQIGNEISGNDDRYLGQFGDFARLMKRSDASVELMTSFPTQPLLNREGGNISFICPHHYTPDLAGCDRDFTRLTQWIESTPGCANIRIAVTEWNISGGDWGLGRGRQQTLASALQNARYLHVMMRHADKVKIGCRSNMANSFCGAIFETSPSGVLKRPSYYVMQLYARHAKPIPLPVQTTENGPDVFACGSDDQKSLVVFAINSRSEPVNWSFEFSGFGGLAHVSSAESVCDQLDAGQPDVMNHWNAPERVKIKALGLTPNGLVLPPLSATAIEWKVN
ncbi:MAG TPA: alpha-L-arabinofuranosidase C-terminal domain-containing protein [Candidatus Acidoferrales bacterium]|nr:alpha-L-arabinofuranosidase C-terminal domain-containing protein [Candidatus Acidoferrales bacterium]